MNLRKGYPCGNLVARAPLADAYIEIAYVS